MKKRILALLLLVTMSLALVACGKTDKKEKDSSKEESNDAIEVEENLFSVELTIPAEYMGETTQEEIDQKAKEEGYKSATLNEDGSVTYIMTKKQHKKMMAELEKSINTAMDEMVQSEDYPNFTKIEANSDFTSFRITTTSEELDFNESFSVLGFYMYGAMYNVFNDTPVDNIHVDFVNANTGAVISSSDSSDMAE